MKESQAVTYAELHFDKNTFPHWIIDLLRARAEYSHHTLSSIIVIKTHDVDEALLQEQVLKWLMVPERKQWREAILNVKGTNRLD